MFKTRTQLSYDEWNFVVQKFKVKHAALFGYDKCFWASISWAKRFLGTPKNGATRTMVHSKFTQSDSSCQISAIDAIFDDYMNAKRNFISDQCMKTCRHDIAAVCFINASLQRWTGIKPDLVISSLWNASHSACNAVSYSKLAYRWALPQRIIANWATRKSV